MAWTITPTIDSIKAIKHEVFGDKSIVLKLACTSDGSGGTITLRTKRAGGTSDTYDEIMERIAGSTLYLVAADPGTGGDQPSGTFVVTITDKNSMDFCVTPANANDAATYTPGSQTAGVIPPIFEELTIAVATLGDGKKADVYLTFWK